MYSNYGLSRIAYSNAQKTALLKFEAYFGKDADVRKELLVSPPVPIPYVPGRRDLDIGAFCDYNVKEEQQYNIMCKLNHVIDNLINAHRKIVWGAMHHLAKGNTKLKVYQLASAIAKQTSYHHGDASINGAIIWLAQDYVGARNIPIFLPLSQFGTRFKADDNAAPRYIDTKVNPIVDAIYPRADRDLFEMLIEDGIATVPKHLVPVVCMPVLETNSIPGTGWAISKWGRDYHEHVANIKRMLMGEPIRPMRPWAPHWRGEVVTINGVEWSVGRCAYDTKTRIVTITELPFMAKVRTYIYGAKMTGAKTAAVENGESTAPFALMRLEHVDTGSIRDRSSKTEICITFTLRPGAIDVIGRNYGSEHFSPLIDYLHLKEHMGAMLNFIHDDGTVRPFATYGAVMIPWFRERLALYPLRFERERIILALKIEVAQARIRYISMRPELKLSGARRSAQTDALAGAGFMRMNMARLKAPGHIPNSAIRTSIVCSADDGGSFDYLLKMSDWDASAEGAAELAQKIDKLSVRMAALSAPDVIQRTWLAEIDEVTRLVDHGIQHGWVERGRHKYKRICD